MRCTKCGNISWDHISICNTCGEDLTEVQKQLGQFPQPEPDFSWFQDLVTEAQAPEDTPPVDLSEIDVSDLIGGEEEELGNSNIDIDIKEIEDVIEDEELQKILEKSLEP